MLFSKLLPVFTFLLFTHFENSRACSCIGPWSPHDAYINAAAVFSGTVQSIDTVNRGTLIVRFSVSQSWKGITSTAAIIYTADSGPACGYPFVVGSTYLVYTYLYEERFHTSSCDRTQSLSSASEDFAFLSTVLPIPSTITLYQNYPNPFNPGTIIQYTIPEQSTVTLEVYSTLGERVTALVNNDQARGIYQVVWEPTNLPSGVYIARLRAGTQSATTKMAFVR